MNRQHRSLVIASVFLTVLNCGCNFDAPPLPAPKVEPEEHFFVHVVSSRWQTLSQIAKWYTGTTKTSGEIEEANVGGVGKTLKVGQQIRIPMYLVKNQKPYGTAEKKHRVTKVRKPTAIPTVNYHGKGSNQVDQTASEDKTSKASQTPVPSVPTVSAISPTFSKISPSVVPMNTPAAVTTSTTPPDPASKAEAERVNAHIASEMERSIEQMIREERAQVERLRKELSTKEPSL